MKSKIKAKLYKYPEFRAFLKKLESTPQCQVVLHGDAESQELDRSFQFCLGAAFLAGLKQRDSDELDELQEALDSQYDGDEIVGHRD